MQLTTYNQAKQIRDRIDFLSSLRSQSEAAAAICSGDGPVRITIACGNSTAEIYPAVVSDVVQRLTAQIEQLNAAISEAETQFSLVQ